MASMDIAHRGVYSPMSQNLHDDNYYLENTNEQIPTFQQVLDLFKGKAPLIVELKSENGNYAELTEAADACGIKLGKIMQNPIEGLVCYHKE